MIEERRIRMRFIDIQRKIKDLEANEGNLSLISHKAVILAVLKEKEKELKWILEYDKELDKSSLHSRQSKPVKC